MQNSRVRKNKVKFSLFYKFSWKKIQQQFRKQILLRLRWNQEPFTSKKFHLQCPLWARKRENLYYNICPIHGRLFSIIDIYISDHISTFMIHYLAFRREWEEFPACFWTVTSLRSSCRWRWSSSRSRGWTRRSPRPPRQ